MLWLTSVRLTLLIIFVGLVDFYTKETGKFNVLITILVKKNVQTGHIFDCFISGAQHTSWLLLKYCSSG